jgi:hypothetical protein
MISFKNRFTDFSGADMSTRAFTGQILGCF